jgi:hypothetical protein
LSDDGFDSGKLLDMRTNGFYLNGIANYNTFMLYSFRYRELTLDALLTLMETMNEHSFNKTYHMDGDTDEEVPI